MAATPSSFAGAPRAALARVLVISIICHSLPEYRVIYFVSSLRRGVRFLPPPLISYPCPALVPLRTTFGSWMQRAEDCTLFSAGTHRRGGGGSGHAILLSIHSARTERFRSIGSFGFGNNLYWIYYTYTRKTQVYNWVFEYIPN